MKKVLFFIFVSGSIMYSDLKEINHLTYWRRHNNLPRIPRTMSKKMSLIKRRKGHIDKENFEEGLREGHKPTRRHGKYNVTLTTRILFSGSIEGDGKFKTIVVSS